MWVVVRSSSPSLRSSTGTFPRTSPQAGQETVTVSPQKPKLARSAVSSPRRWSPMYTSANRRHVNGLGVSGGVVCVVRMVPPFLNGCAVFVPKHALAMAHAIEGGKCKVWEKWPSGQPQAGGSEYLELHGAFSIALRAPGAALLRRLGFLAGRGAREIAFVFVVAFQPIRDGVAGRTQARRGGWRRTRTRPQTGGDFRPQSITASAFVSALRL
jgi:hypothetical protein